MPYAPSMQRSQAFARGYAFEAAMLALAAAAAIETAVGSGRADTDRLSPWVAAPAAAAVVVPLLLRRWWPVVALFGVWVIAAAVSFMDGRLVISTGSLFVGGTCAAFLLGTQRNATHSRAGLVAILVSSAIIAYNEPGGGTGVYVFTPASFALAWIAGLAIQQRGSRAEAAEQHAATLVRDREESTRAAIAAERTRIARELHDVLGHSVSVMTIQASAVRRMLTPEQTREREALLIVERTGREALAEMRRLVGILRLPEDDPGLEPQPGLDRVASLVEQARELGFAVDLRIEGEPTPLPPGLDLTAYRLVQEGLTNARKHSNASQTDVRLCYEPGCLEIEVSDNGRGATTTDQGGHGLAGMRERVTIYNGEFEAGPRPGGGFRLRARLPVPQ